MSVKDEADILARELFEAKSRLRAAGRALHDQVGPLLSAAGISLDLLRSDHPQAAASASQIMQTLEQAMDRVRALSRGLNPPSELHFGLKKALEALVERVRESFKGKIEFTWAATVVPPDDAAAAIYEAVSAALALAANDSTARRLSISARGARNLTVTVGSDGKARWSAAALAAQNRRVLPAGIALADSTKKSTIVSIHYGPGRLTRG